MAAMHRAERPGIVLVVMAVVVLPVLIHGWPVTAAGNAFTVALLAGGLTLTWWRSRPRLAVELGGALWLAAAFLGGFGWFPATALILLTAMACVAALAWSGRAAWAAGLGVGAYLLVLWLVLTGTSVIALVVLTAPGFLAGTVLRLHRETAGQLARRNRELEAEHELFAEVTTRHERARIAAELHDIIGHAISVMVIQAAAGQRLVDHHPARARQAFADIAESARQGQEDLGRLIELLSGTDINGPDLALIEEVVARAARSGLDVSCRFEGDRDGVSAPASRVAFRVVQESLTNALRYAPGSGVRVLVSGSGRGLVVRVENDPASGERPGLSGTGGGLAGLGERVRGLGGQLIARPTESGGWLVEAILPA
jgi:signal transduction histidine kinase